MLLFKGNEHRSIQGWQGTVLAINFQMLLKLKSSLYHTCRFPRKLKSISKEQKKTRYQILYVCYNYSYSQKYINRVINKVINIRHSVKVFAFKGAFLT